MMDEDIEKQILSFHKKTFYATAWILVLTIGILGLTWVLVDQEKIKKENEVKNNIKTNVPVTLAGSIDLILSA